MPNPKQLIQWIQDIFEAIDSVISGGKVAVDATVERTTSVANAPIDAAGLAVDVNTTVRIDGTTDLVAGAKYLVEIWPDVAAGGSLSDVIWGWIKSATSVGSQGDGIRIATGYPREIIPVAGKLNLSFMRDSNTEFPCRVYVHRTDA